MMENSKIAIDFVDSLVPGKFEQAQDFLSEECTYQYGDRKLTNGAIVESFKENHRNASSKLDSVEYSGAEVESKAEDVITVKVQDIIKKGNKEFIYTDRLVIRVENDQILEIIHKPFPKERQKLKTFLDKVDVKL